MRTQFEARISVLQEVQQQHQHLTAIAAAATVNSGGSKSITFAAAKNKIM